MSAVSEEDVLVALVLWHWLETGEDIDADMYLDDGLGIPEAIGLLARERLSRDPNVFPAEDDERAILDSERRWEVEKAERAVIDAAERLIRAPSVKSHDGVRGAAFGLWAARRALEGR